MQKFIDSIKAANIGDRTLRVRGYEDTQQVFINFYNLPEAISGLRVCGGAEAENNRVMLTCEFLKSGKVKVSQSVNALGKEWRLRGKTAAPEKVAIYVVEYLEKVVREVEPKYTHTKVDKF